MQKEKKTTDIQAGRTQQIGSIRPAVRRQEMKIIHQRGQKIFNQRGLQAGNKQTYRQEENIKEEEQKK